MRLVENWSEIAANIRTFLNGLSSLNEDERQYFERMLLRGICFVAATRGTDTVFAPSRFIGYLENSRANHDSNDSKHGAKTNAAITRVLRTQWTNSAELEDLYGLYCESLEVSPRDSGSFRCPRRYIDARARRV